VNIRKSVLAATLIAASTFALAQSFPSRTVRFVSGVTPGSASDTMARILAERLQTTLGHPVIVENRLGAGGLVGARYVASSEPDGHLIMMYTSAFTLATLINPGLDAKELQPVATVATIPTVLVTAPEKGYRKLSDLVAAAKANPGKLACTTAGVGSSTHMNLERFRFSAGVEFLNVHMKGANEALTEVLTGRADCYFALIFQALKNVEAGKLVALGLGSPKRSSLMPDVPTTVEQGYANSDYNFWIGALVSAKTPREIVERLHREIDAAVQSAEISERIRKLGADPLSMPIQSFEAMVREELLSNAQLIKAAGIKTN